MTHLHHKNKRKISSHIIFNCLLIFLILQGWPMSEIGPFEALMLLCSYEEWTKETIDPKKLESRELKLNELLTQEDFDMAHSVSIFLLNHFVLQVSYLNPDFYPNFSQLSPSGYCIINFFFFLWLQLAFPIKIRLATVSPYFSHSYILVCTVQII